MELQFEWDDRKAEKNYKHGVSFEDAAIVFNDPFAYIFDDELHSVEEQREIIIGNDQKNRLLLVCFIERQGVIRIISARLATNKERRDYEEYIASTRSIGLPISAILLTPVQNFCRQFAAPVNFERSVNSVDRFTYCCSRSSKSGYKVIRITTTTICQASAANL